MLLVTMFGCGARTELDVLETQPADAQTADVPRDVADAGQDVAPDVGPEAAVCDYGDVVSDVFGQTIYFAGGASLPKGHYTVTYVDGCMKYSPSQGWTVNAYASGPDVYWLVTGASQQKLGVPPGTVGYTVANGAFALFDACVNASRALPPLGLDFPGGTLGVWLADNPYSDNVPGESGRNPTWHLSACSGD